MSHPVTLAPGSTTAPGQSSWTVRREARLRPECAHLYPGLRAGVWEVAAVVVDRIVAARLLRGGLAMRDRVLSNSHFDFRGGTDAGSRPRREDR
jgi:hypothetical protein